MSKNDKFNLAIKIVVIVLASINLLLISAIIVFKYYNNRLEFNTSVLEKNTNEILGEYTKEALNKEVEKLDKEVNQVLSLYLEYNINTDDKNGYIQFIEELKQNIEEKSKDNKELKLKKETLTNKYSALQEKWELLTTYIIPGVTTINQNPRYPNGCEGIALAILLRYYGVNVNIDSVMEALPKGKTPYTENGILYGGNPNYEFLGDPRSIEGWGIWDKGLAITANKFKSGIINGTGMDFSEVLEIVKSNRPVIIWTSIGLKSPRIYKKWIYKETGEIITWKSYNHAVVVVGYSDGKIIVSDPIDGKIKYFDKDNFIYVYNYMGKKAIYY
ncbi:MAG: C39 family peptidase [Clostridia bacterium]|nr:C39 family peptidase [Clostridia bacterium]